VNRVSIIIPVYNGEAVIARAIDSALSQNFADIEVIAVNDGSTDSTARMLASYGSRIKIISQPNRGPAAARNAGVAACDSRYIAFLDADDVWLSGKLASTCTALDANPRAALAFSDYMVAEADGEARTWPRVGPAPSMEDLLSAGWDICTSSVVMRRSVFQRCGGFCEEFRRPGFEDPYMWLRAREHGEFEYVPEPLVIYHVAPFTVRAEKYDAGREIFVRLVRERYGKSARGLINAVALDYASAMMQRALAQMDSGDRKGALRTWMRVLRAKPSCLFSADNIRRVFHPRNVRRMVGMFAGTS
jgi:glycosyltransferase involved in cell wall biosynthesis